MTATTKRPAGAKAPQDHQEPRKGKPKPDGEGKYHVTVRGVDYTVDADALDDYDVLEALEQDRFIPALQALLTAEEIEAVKKSLRDPDTKRVRGTAMRDFTIELLGALNPNS